MTISKQMVGLAVCLAVVFAAGVIGLPFTTYATSTWYHQIARPSWNPPDWLFGPVWMVLYVMMAVAVWSVWREQSAVNRLAIRLFIVQLALNAAWTPIFFGLRLFGLAAVEIALLFCSIVLCTLVFRRVKPLAAWLMVPYVAWVGFAGALNVSIWWLNR